MFLIQFVTNKFVKYYIYYSKFKFCLKKTEAATGGVL